MLGGCCALAILNWQIVCSLSHEHWWPSPLTRRSRLHVPVTRISATETTGNELDLVCSCYCDVSQPFRIRFHAPTVGASSWHVWSHRSMHAWCRCIVCRWNRDEPIEAKDVLHVYRASVVSASCATQGIADISSCWEPMHSTFHCKCEQDRQLCITEPS